GRQERVRAFAFNNLFGDVHGNWLDVCPVSKLGVSHHRRRVAVEEDHLHALFLQRFGGLGAGIVKLASLADDDGPAADDQNLVNVAALGHRAGACTTKRQRAGRRAPRLRSKGAPGPRTRGEALSQPVRPPTKSRSRASPFSIVAREAAKLKRRCPSPPKGVPGTAASR